MGAMIHHPKHTLKLTYWSLKQNKFSSLFFSYFMLQWPCTRQIYIYIYICYERDTITKGDEHTNNINKKFRERKKVFVRTMSLTKNRKLNKSGDQTDRIPGVFLFHFILFSAFDCVLHVLFDVQLVEIHFHTHNGTNDANNIVNNVVWFVCGLSVEPQEYHKASENNATDSISIFYFAVWWASTRVVSATGERE